MVEGFLQRGWARWPMDRELTGWIDAVRPAALDAVADPAQRAEWLQCEGTWFVGVDSLPNDVTGQVGHSGPLCGAAYGAARDLYGDLPLHRAQLSVIYPGYPRPREGESDGAFRYRRSRDAAHVDGLLAVGDARQRMLKERHAYILGLPLTDCTADASPLVVWEGSHEVMRRAFAGMLDPVPETAWSEIDLTEVYQSTRAQVFETCRRIELPARPGEATLVHRLALHGVAPWGEAAQAPEQGRMIAYFRPELPDGTRDWLDLP